MNPTATRYDAADRPLAALLDGVPDESWTNPSPCEGWSARNVVRHLIETQRDFLTGHGIDLGEAPDIDLDPAAAWQEHAKRVAAAVADDSLVATPFDGHFGPTTIGSTLEQFYVWDMLVHRWDVARAVGAEAALSETELDRIEAGADSFGDALYMDGICRPGMPVASDADRTSRVLARLGRSL
jgi:uncharacterized protein (TIGR03086 family)